MDDLKNWVKTSTYDALRLSEYRGKWSIMAGNVGDNDTYDKWINPLKWQNGENVAVNKKDGSGLLVLPLQIPLGDKENALKILQNLYHQLKNMR